MCETVLLVRDVDTGRWLTEVGECGELYVAGRLVVPGYYASPTDGSVLADDNSISKFSRFHETAPEAARKAFSSAGFVTSKECTMFRTGDMVTWRSDGELDCCGRADDQVKVNGVRIELGDVTSATLRCEGVEAAVAVAAPDETGAARVVVFASPAAAPRQRRC